MAALRDALPAGSHLVLSHATADFHASSLPEIFEIYRKATTTLNTRPRDEIAGCFFGLDLLEPGLVQVPLWRPERQPAPEDVRRVGFCGGVAREL